MPQQESIDPTATNLKWWNERGVLHAGSLFYDLEGVVNGDMRLNPYEIEEVGNVEGKRLLHLQSHLGIETVGWARLGAITSGLDFSNDTINEARDLAERCGVKIDYHVGDVYDAPGVVGENEFDIVYVSGGSLHWLPDSSADRYRLAVPAGTSAFSGGRGAPRASFCAGRPGPRSAHRWIADDSGGRERACKNYSL